MKKILIVLASILAGLIVLVLLAAAVMPKDFKIEREIVIDKPKAEVFGYIKMMQKNGNSWSPWIKKDPKMVQTSKGTDGTVGYVGSWSGNSEVGVGEEEITNIVPNERIDMELRFSKPMKATRHAYYITETIGADQTRVIWGMTGTTPFPYNAICFFMQKKVGAEFAAGLGNLREVLEKPQEKAQAVVKEEMQEKAK